MSCLDVQDLMVEYLLGELDSEHRAKVESHLATGCSECQIELHALTESVDALWQAVPNKKLSDSVQQEIVARVRAGAPRVTIDKAAEVSPRTASVPLRLMHNPIAQAMIAFAAGVLCMIFIKTDNKVEVATQRATTSVNLASPRIPKSLQMSEKKYESTQLVSLRQKPDSSELRGHVLCDALTREIHIFCRGLQQPPSGTQYVLWLVGPGIEILAAERLEIDAAGVCKVAVPWPEGDFRFVKVTLEKSSRLNSKPSNDVALTSNAFEPFAN